MRTDVAQKVYEKAIRLTMPRRRDELRQAFKSAGFRLSDDDNKVLSVGNYQKLSQGLKSKLPTALIAIKRLLRNHGISL